jgi:hypothetical protein
MEGTGCGVTQVSDIVHIATGFSKLQCYIVPLRSYQIEYSVVSANKELSH